jgi:hypothetical protein
MATLHRSASLNMHYATGSPPTPSPEINDSHSYSHEGWSLDRPRFRRQVDENGHRPQQAGPVLRVLTAARASRLGEDEKLLGARLRDGGVGALPAAGFRDLGVGSFCAATHVGSARAHRVLASLGGEREQQIRSTAWR